MMREAGIKCALCRLPGDSAAARMRCSGQPEHRSGKPNPPFTDDKEAGCASALSSGRALRGHPYLGSGNRESLLPPGGAR
jgi:hypothetical protein